jgi:transposase
MRIVTLDVHAELCQMLAVTEHGEVIIELQVETRPEELRRVVGGIPGPKRVVFEEGPLSGMIYDALKDVADEVISCDPTRNPYVSEAEVSDDERDTRRLSELAVLGKIHKVHIPEEPHRTLRSLTHHEYALTREITRVKNQLKALCRRCGIRYRGTGIYGPAGRARALSIAPNSFVKWQLESTYRRLRELRFERTRARRFVAKCAKKLPAIKRIKTAPGMGPTTAPTVVAWIVDPTRFKSRSAISSYGGLGLKKDVSAWKAVSRPRASMRGQRELKRALFLAARAALRGKNALRTRYDARIAAGWEDRKAIRDIARTILFVVCAIWRNGGEYDDGRVNVPVA